MFLFKIFYSGNVSKVEKVNYKGVFSLLNPLKEQEHFPWKYGQSPKCQSLTEQYMESI